MQSREFMSLVTLAASVSTLLVVLYVSFNQSTPSASSDQMKALATQVQGLAREVDELQLMVGASSPNTLGFKSIYTITTEAGAAAASEATRANDEHRLLIGEVNGIVTRLTVLCIQIGC